MANQKYEGTERRQDSSRRKGDDRGNLNSVKMRKVNRPTVVRKDDGTKT